MNGQERYLGIDTGGTFTDGVLFDPADRRVIQSVKTLTTHHDLKKCVLEVLERLVPIEPDKITLVGLSTTLATNAVAEGKRKPVALFLLGYDPDLVRQFKFERQFGTPNYFFIDGLHDQHGREVKALDEQALASALIGLNRQVEAIAVSSYHGPMNAGHEERAGDVLREAYGKPVVQAHHLSSELDSIRRAATASLNASLLANLDEFTQAVQEMLARHGVVCPVMIVRGDGSVMQLDYARRRPVEMIHSGPATSAIGGQYLAAIERGLVVDVGGTTTDLALVERGTVQAARRSATVGSYRTCVHTIHARSFGMGGDSRILFDHWGNLKIGPERVIPFARYCALYPMHRQMIQNWLESNRTIHYSEKLEFWTLRKQTISTAEDPLIRRVAQILQAGPAPYFLLREQTGPIAPVMVQEMVNLEIIDRIGLTPTDLLHASGDFTEWDAAIAETACEIAAFTLGMTLRDFRQKLSRQITRQIAAEIVQFLSGLPFSDDKVGGSAGMDHWLFNQNFEPEDPFLGSKIHLKAPIVGIGAPAKYFLPPVAELFGTEVLFPDYYAVANAVGTVVGKVVVRKDAEIFPSLDGALIGGYYARVENRQKLFAHFEEAREYAREMLRVHVREELAAAGAQEDDLQLDEQMILEGMARLYAVGIGRPGSVGK